MKKPAGCWEREKGVAWEGKGTARWWEQQQRPPRACICLWSADVEDEARKGQRAKALKAKVKQVLPSDGHERRHCCPPRDRISGQEFHTPSK